MQNKGAVKLLAILLTLVCIYQLSFTLVTKLQENKAKEYAKVTPATQSEAKEYAQGDQMKEQQYIDSVSTLKEEKYLDSISGKEVYNLGFKKYTYRECQEKEISLGLDLKGGMNVILEVSVVDVINSLSNYNKDTTYLKAIALAKKMQENSQEDFVTLFGKAFKQVDPNARLAAVFNTFELKEKINYNSTNEDVLKVIREQTNAAIDNSFKILSTRINKFGVVSPNIQKLQTAGRLLVELPGVKDPKRVRKLLQGTANLEFWETYENSEVYQYLLDANAKIKGINDAAKSLKDSVAVASNIKTKIKDKKADKAKVDTSKNDVALLDQLKSDTTKTTDTSLLKGEGNFPLFSVLLPATNGKELFPGDVVGYANANDTAQVNKYLALKQVQSLFPRDILFLWSVKPSKMFPKDSKYELHAIKITGRDGKAPLTGDVVVSARADFGQKGSNAEVSMSMNGEGAKIWGRMTKDNLKRCIAIVLDNTVYSAPRVQSEINGGSSQITGDFTPEEAKDLANVLESGKLPAPARIIQETVVGPTLGKESIEAGLMSFIVAFIGVLLYMWLYYHRAGNVANVALFANVLFLFGTITSIGTVLTLPGIAGMVLTLAMAVDGNVIIYERMREEVRAGKGMRLVVKDGFWHAYSSIIDGHVTTILTGVVLFLFGSGPIKGFAVTLVIGLLLSLFSSIFIARLMFEWMLDKEIKIPLGNRFTINAFTKVNIDFIGLRKIMYIASAVTLIIALISLGIRGLDPSVEFSGGRTYIVRFDKVVTTQDVRHSLTTTFGDAPEVKTFGPHGNQLKITTKYLINEKTPKADSIVDVALYEGVKSHFVKSITYDEFSSNDPKKVIGELQSQKVDPTMSDDLIKQAFMAVFFGLLIIFIYIAIRFKNWRYGLGGVISLFHDTMIVIGCFSLFYKILPFSLEIDQSFIAALLTIIGYSIMDTVIIFDRIREYTKLYPKRDMALNINTAINHTLGRTINTSGITIVVLLVIFIFGGEMLQGFIFALLIGVTIGTYSSVFVATPIAYDFIMRGNKKNKEALKAE
jgi:SecD/SecF fusion protein